MKFLISLALFLVLASPARSEPLKATIEHSKFMPAMSSALAPGNQFSKERLYLPTSEKWVQIPDWYAGEFKNTESWIVSVRDLKTGQRQDINQRDDAKERIISIGCQCDANGNYWELIEVGKRIKHELNERTQYSVDRSIDLQCSPEAVQVFTRGPAVLVKQDGTILKSNQTEQISVSRPTKYGTITVTSIVEFSAEGSPLLETIRKTRHIRVGPYKEAPETRESFERFSKQNQIPISPQPARD